MSRGSETIDRAKTGYGLTSLGRKHGRDVRASVGLLGFSRVAVAGFERVGFELEAREEVREKGDVDLLRMLLRDLRLRERGEEAEGGGRGDEDDAAREEGEHYGY